MNEQQMQARIDELEALIRKIDDDLAYLEGVGLRSYTEATPLLASILDA
jgi:hypothetical protein